MRESEIERKLVRYCKDLGMLTYKFVSPNNRGVPDRIILHGGRVLFVELKQKGKKPTTLQLHEMHRIESSGCEVNWTDSWEDTRKLLTSFYAGE